MDIQGNLDLLVAYANKIALGLSMKEHAINERMIDVEGRTVYSLNMPHSLESYRKYTGPGNQYNVLEENSPCNYALGMVDAAMSLNALYARRTKELITSAFGRSLTFIKKEEEESEGMTIFPVASFGGVDCQQDWTKQKIREFVVTNYRRTPHEIRELMKSFNLSPRLIKQWIKYSQKTEKIMELREEVMKQSFLSRVTLSDFKRIARKIYKTRLFHATDKWCLNYIRRYHLEELVEIPEKLK